MKPQGAVATGTAGTKTAAPRKFSPIWILVAVLVAALMVAVGFILFQQTGKETATVAPPAPAGETIAGGVGVPTPTPKALKPTITPTASVPSPTSVISVTSTELSREFDNDQFAAGKKYRGRTLDVTGTDFKIYGDFTGFVVRFPPANTSSPYFSYVECIFNGTEGGRDPSYLFRGKTTITVRGTFSGLNIAIYLRDCSLRN